MVVVTGASRGLGKAIALHLASQGEQVLGLARSKVGCEFPLQVCDVTQPDNLKAFALDLKHSKQPVKALINVAGVASMNLALTTPTETMQRIVATNLLGTMFACQQIVPLMVRQGQGGVVINFSTIAVVLGLAGESAYVASKAGVEAFSRAFAREVSGFGIRVNCIAPGPIATDLIKGVPQNKIDLLVSRQVLQKQFEPQDVCDLVDLLLDPKAKNLSGQVLHLGGV